MTPARPMLADVLAYLADHGGDARWWREMLDTHPVSIEESGIEVSRHADRWEELAAWAHATPVEAVEALHTGALWPFPTDGDRAARWWCERCDAIERRRRGDEVPTFAAAQPKWRGCGEAGTTALPESIAEVVAVASLGASALLRAASLAEEIARAAGHPKAAVVLRVMAREAIEEHHARASFEARGFPIAVAPFFSYIACHWSDVAWPERCPVAADSDGERMWPMMRALARADVGAPTGVHLVGLDEDAVTLAVESLP